jgi:chorismate mutase
MDHSSVNEDKTLDGWRRQIDALDTELLRLLNQRAAIACEIASIKVASGLPAYDGNRERQVLARVIEKNTGPLDDQSVTDIFSGIIRETRRLGTQRMEEQNKERSLESQRQQVVDVFSSNPEP